MEDTDWLRAAPEWDEGSRGLFPVGIEGEGVLEAVHHHSRGVTTDSITIIHGGHRLAQGCARVGRRQQRLVSCRD